MKRIALLFALTVTTAQAQQRTAAADSAAVVDVATRFHAALATGDSTAALALLTDDVTILESGGAETRAQYREHHLPADIAYAKAVKSTRAIQKVVVSGDVAWLAATSTTTGEFNGRAVNSSGAETIVFARTAQGWKISSVHWSSRARRGAP
ncbi:MAG TPA: DUF4440 domain-containing protein [Gemmatimonadaceae bacterium]|nr:DUF4440 domain-containing protein [Gemmatimonadaceae bacterium]